MVASLEPLAGDLARNPGMCSDWELNLRPFGSQPMPNPLSYTSQGCTLVFEERMNGLQTVKYTKEVMIPILWKILGGTTTTAGIE